MSKTSARVDMLAVELRDLKQLLDERAAADRAALAAALSTTEKAVTEAKEAAKDRAKAENGVRDEMRVQAGTFASKDALGATDARVSRLEQAQATGSGRVQGVSAVWTVVVGLAGVLAVIVAIFARR